MALKTVYFSERYYCPICRADYDLSQMLYLDDATRKLRCPTHPSYSRDNDGNANLVMYEDIDGTLIKPYIPPKDKVGPQGPKGDTGPQGPIGPKGDKGDQGLKGDKGEAGASVKSLKLTTTPEGQINGGEATLTDESKVVITIEPTV